MVPLLNLFEPDLYNADNSFQWELQALSPSDIRSFVFMEFNFRQPGVNTAANIVIGIAPNSVHGALQTDRQGPHSSFCAKQKICRPRGLRR